MPSAILGVGGVTAIDTSVAADTVKLTGAEVVPFSAAVMLLGPAATEGASPFEPAALLIVATEIVADAQVTWVLRFWVELSEKVPVAVNCCVVPSAMLGVGG